MRKEQSELCRKCNCIGGHDIECHDFRFQHILETLVKMCDYFYENKLSIEERRARLEIMEVCTQIAEEIKDFRNKERNYLWQSIVKRK